MPVKITQIAKNSIANELGLMVGDEIAEINDDRVNDIIDYRFFMSDEEIRMGVFRDGKKFYIEFGKDPDDPLGAEFEDFTYKACGDDCVFCFVDQNPDGLRKPIYFRDGDFRLSFLYGNYTTLTNLGPNSLKRIIRQRLTPMYISVHSTVPEVRMQLMGHKKDDMLLPKMKYLADNDIEMHTQVVLCPNINDGESLVRTISDLYEMNSKVMSLSIVPVGLTKHREGLAQLQRVDKDYAIKLIEKMSMFQSQFKRAIGRNFVYLGDEIYLAAGVPPPPAEHYDGFSLTENGVGMVTKFISEFGEQRREFPKKLSRRKKVTLATGVLATDILTDVVGKGLNEIEKLDAQVVTCRNLLYGDIVTCVGLLSGNCFYQALKDHDLGAMVVLPSDSVNYDGVFLDDMTPKQLSEKLGGVKVKIFNGSWAETLGL
jgi:putative radical SAM enzyme (TIGR03279 family)